MEWLFMHMPMAGVNVFWPGLLLIGFSVGVIGGFFGMGGAWMVTPGLNILGFPMAYAIGTDVAHMAGKSIVSTHRHAQFGNVDFKLGVTMIVGTVGGIECGARMVMWLEHLGWVEAVVRWAYVGVLASVALLIFADYRQAVKNQEAGIVEERGAVGFTWYKTLHEIKIPPMMHFPVADVYCSVWLPIFVTFVTGVMAGFLGIGGGLLRMPALVHLVGCPTHIAIGTDLFEVMISGLYGTFTYGVKGRIEMVAVLVMLTGAAIGAQIGTVATKYAKGYGIRIAFGLTAVACMISVLLKQFSYPGPATIVILGSVATLCLYICMIMFKGAIKELAEIKFHQWRIFRRPWERTAEGLEVACRTRTSETCQEFLQDAKLEYLIDSFDSDKNSLENLHSVHGGGFAWWVRPAPDRPWNERFGEFDISEQLYSALFHLGITDRLNELPHDGLLDAHEEGILLMSGLARASELLKESAENLVEDSYELSCGKRIGPEEIDCKIEVEAKTLKQDLASLAEFLRSAGEKGFDVQLWL